MVMPNDPPPPVPRDSAERNTLAIAAFESATPAMLVRSCVSRYLAMSQP